MMTASENGFRTYQLYNSINLHFTVDANYDALTYNFKTNAKFETYEKRPDRIFFEILAKKHDPKGYIAFNRAIHGYVSIKNLIREKVYEKTYNQTAGTIQSLSYKLKTRLGQFGTSARDILEIQDGQHPLLIRKFLSKHLDLLDLVIFNQCYNYAPYFDRNIVERVYWPTLGFKINKMSPFVEIDVPKIRGIFDDYYQTINSAVEQQDNT